MLLTRLLPPQFLLPAWSARQLHHVLQRAQKSDGASPKRKKSFKAFSRKLEPSLFEELFPEESTPRSQAEPNEKVEKLPTFEWAEELRPSIGKNRLREKDPIYSIPQPSSQVPEHPKSKPALQFNLEGERQRQRNDISVLVLNCASKTLEESDFFRLSPKGEHIEGWTSGIIKVIPGRDSRTLESLGHYFILFSSDAAARAYHDQIVRLHTLSKMHTRRSVTSPLPPPPGYLVDGEDLHATLRGFTLIPASHNTASLRMLARPYRPAVSQMISNGGPAAVANWQRKAGEMVLFSIDRGHISLYDVRRVLGEDGRHRNLHWELAGGDQDIVALSKDGEDAAGELPEEPSKGMEMIHGSKKRSFSQPSRFILCFKDRHEARRFVREWHRRPLPPTRERNPGDEPPPVVNVKTLW